MASSTTHSRKNPRVVCVQWEMLSTHRLAELLARMETIIRQAARDGGDVVMFPELFTLPLLGLWKSLPPVQAMYQLAQLSPAIVEVCTEWAVQHRINVIAGSLPQLENGVLFNVATFCHRDGRPNHCQYKLHATPYEKREWNMQGGNALRVFDTDCGTAGILICYDVEFPELARLLSEQQMQILFVPFWTDSHSAYLRVRYCAQARAIENECYVVMAGSMGVMDDTDVTDVQYAQSAVFSPSDVPFPDKAIVAEADANIAMSLVADLDLAKLDELRTAGAVQNSKDKRSDLYKTDWMGDM